MNTVRRRYAPLLAVGASFLLLSACATEQEGARSSADYTAENVAEAPVGEAALGQEVDQQLVTTGWSTVIVDDPAAAASSATEIADRLGGQVSSSSLSAYDGDPTADVTIRIPAERHDDLLRQLGELGEVQSSGTTAADVGQDVVDLKAQQAALQGSIDRLTELKAQATTTQDLLAAEDMMTQRQGELDSLTGQLKYLEDQVAMSSQQVTFTTGSETDSLWDEIRQALVDSSRALLLVVVGLLPWLVVGGLLAWAVVAIVKSVRRRRKPGAGETSVD